MTKSTCEICFTYTSYKAEQYIGKYSDKAPPNLPFSPSKTKLTVGGILGNKLGRRGGRRTASFSPVVPVVVAGLAVRGRESSLVELADRAADLRAERARVLAADDCRDILLVIE